MEDSRNIIKAIDGLTVKAGGQEVDSKNITEAIDNLKAVFDQKAIGIDTTLSQAGLAADAKAVGDYVKQIDASTFSEAFSNAPTGRLSFFRVRTGTPDVPADAPSDGADTSRANTWLGLQWKNINSKYGLQVTFSFLGGIYKREWQNSDEPTNWYSYTRTELQ